MINKNNLNKFVNLKYNFIFKINPFYLNKPYRFKTIFSMNYWISHFKRSQLIKRSINGFLILPLLLHSNILRANGSDKQSPAELFRSKFFNLMPEDSQYNQKQHLLYPTDFINNILVTPKNNLKSIEDYFLESVKNIKAPNEFLLSSLKKSISSDSEPHGIHTSNLKKGKFKSTPLIIIIPGIFAEFIKDHAFEDLLDNSNLNIAQNQTDNNDSIPNNEMNSNLSPTQSENQELNY